MHSLTAEKLEAIGDEMYGNCAAQTYNRQFVTPVNAVFNANKVPTVLTKRKTSKGKKANIKKAVLYEDAVKVINALPLSTAEIIFFLFYTGMRPIEAITLKPQDINLDGKWITLSDTKTDTPRGVPIHDVLVPMLSRNLDREFVFLNANGKPWPTNKLENSMGRTIAQRGGQFDTPLRTAEKKTRIRITPYMARHTVATYLIYPGCVNETVKNEIMGHGAKGDVSLDYIHLPRQAHIDAINVLPVPVDLRKDLL